MNGHDGELNDLDEASWSSFSNMFNYEDESSRTSGPKLPSKDGTTFVPGIDILRVFFARYFAFWMTGWKTKEG